MTGLTDRDLLALTAALAPVPQARDAWHRLIGLEPFSLASMARARVFPGIFMNLKGQRDIAHYDQLKGAYRAAWVANLIRATQVAPLIAALPPASVVVKGAAVVALTTDWGMRTMGDVDIVVALTDYPRVLELLGEHGYAPAFGAHHDASRPPYSLGWEGPLGQFVDVHTAGVANDSKVGAARLLPLALKTRELSPVSHGLQWGIPRREVLALWAVAHATRGYAEGDMNQGLVDLAKLWPGLSVPALLELAAETGLSHRLADALEALAGASASFGREPVPDIVAELRRHDRALPARQSSVRVLGTRVSELWRFRRLGPGDVRAIVGATQLRRGRYLLFSMLGRLVRLETLIIKNHGGFFREPAEPAWPAEPAALAVIAGPETSLEWRHLLRVSSSGHGQAGILRIQASGIASSVVYVNGVHVTALFTANRFQADVILAKIPPRMEVSIRGLTGRAVPAHAPNEPASVTFSLTDGSGRAHL